MLQKEVADRIVCPPGSRTYGILSVLLQTFFTVKRSFIVEPGAFAPPPKVKSAVVDLKRNDREHLPCKYATLKSVVKLAFQARRKTLRNALKTFTSAEVLASLPYMDLRAEQLTCDQFIELSVLLEK
jgi:16S rRNA (adenine1518-N6/adenine1519-N6)-dimethyltransferase